MQIFFCRKIPFIFMICVFVVTGCGKTRINNDMGAKSIPPTLTEPVTATNTPMLLTPTPKQTEELPTTSAWVNTDEQAPALSGRIVFESRREDSNNDGTIDLSDHIQLFLMDMTNNKVTQLTFGHHHSLDPSWSPNGDKIVFSANPKGIYNLFVMNADGGEIQQINSTEFDELSPAWSPNGDYIAYESVNRNSLVSTLKIISPQSMSITNLDTGDSNSPSRPSWSPDSKYLAFADRYKVKAARSAFILDIESGNVIRFAPNEIREMASLVNPIWLPTNNEYMLSVEQVPGNLSSATAMIFKLAFNDGAINSHLMFTIEDSFGEMVWANEGYWLISTLSDSARNSDHSAEIFFRELVKVAIDFRQQEHKNRDKGIFYSFSLIDNNVPLTTNNFYDGDADWTP